MGRTRLQLRQGVAKAARLPFVSGTNTVNVSDVTSVAGLGRFNTNQLAGNFFYLTNGSPTEDNLTITGNVVTTGVVSFIPTITVNSATTWELLPFPADAIHTAIDEALLLLYDTGVLVRPSWMHAVSGSPIYNADMSYWTSSSALHGWTVATSTLARTQTAANKWIGENVAGLSGSAGTLTLDPAWARFLADQAPGSLRLHAWLAASAASANVTILENGSSLADSGDHPADSDYHVVSTDETELTDAETDISVRLNHNSGNTYMSLLWVEPSMVSAVHPIPVPPMPDGPEEILMSPVGWDETNTKANVFPRGSLSAITGWDFVKYHDEAADVETGLIIWRSRPPAGRMLWLKGSSPFSLPTSDTAVVELNQMEALLVEKLAAIRLLETRPGTMTQFDLQTRDALSRDIDRLIAGHGDTRASAYSLGPNW